MTLTLERAYELMEEARAALTDLAKNRSADARSTVEALSTRFPLDTAPKDGTWVLLHSPDLLAPVVSIWDDVDWWKTDEYADWIRFTEWQHLPDAPDRFVLLESEDRDDGFEREGSAFKVGMTRRQSDQRLR